MAVSLSVVDGALQARFQAPQERQQLMALGGRLKGLDRVDLPATVAFAANLAATVAVEPAGEPARELLDRVARALAARELRDAPPDRLPDLPGGGGWLHQRQAYAFAVEQEASGLWVAMGGGKSRVATSIAVAHHARAVLVTCPRTVLDEDDVWRKQFDRWAPDAGYLVAGRVYGRRGAKAKPSVADRLRALRDDRDRARAAGRPLVAVVPWDSFWRGDLYRALLDQEWDLWIEDEAHRIKAPGGKASTSAARLRPRARRRVGLSGTPLPHSRLDAYGVYRALDPGVFGTNYHRFKSRYARTVPLPNAPRAEKVVGWQNEDEFDRKFHSIAYEWEQDRAVLGIPEPVWIERAVRLDRETWRVYRELDEELIADVDRGAVVASNALVRLLRLQQVLSGVVTLDDGTRRRIGDEKARALREILEDLQAGEPVVAFGRFHGDLDSAHWSAKEAGRRSDELSGRTHGGLDPWKAGASEVLAVQIQAGGSGIDLTRARYGVYMSVGFSLEHYLQSQARLDRPGQVWPPTFVRLVAEGPNEEPTMDHDVYEALDDRRDAVEAVLRARRRG